MAISLPETGPLIEAAVKAQPQLVPVESRSQAESCFSLSARMQRLVYEPFKAIASKASLAKTLLSDPYLIIIDGLDECVDKKGVQEFIAANLTFFDQNPSLPLRILITSRVEQHIHSRLVTSSGVRLKDLGDHCTRRDIQKFMRIVFDAETKGNPIIQAHIRQNGSWPSRADSNRLVDHIGGSFIFASTLFKFIFQEPVSPNDHSTPLDRFPLALNIDPGLDGLYSQTLARSAHLPYFTDIISTLALTAKPLPISGIAELLDIQASAVAQVLVDLQAIVQVPGTDDAPVTFYHTSLRDFLTTESRSGQLFVPTSFHARLFIGCLSCELRARRRTPKVRLDRQKQTAAVQYSLERRYTTTHWNDVCSSFTSDNLKKIVQLQREQVELLPADDKTEGLEALANELISLFYYDGLASNIEEAVSTHREGLGLRPHPHPDRHYSLNNLGIALGSLFKHSQRVADIEEAISMHREALSLRPYPHPDRHHSLNNLGAALNSLFKHSQRAADIEEAISMHREALSLCPRSHPDRHYSLNHLGTAFDSLFEHSRRVADIEEAISMHREALSLHPHPHPYRHYDLSGLGAALNSLFESSRCVADIEEAVSMHREALSLRPHPHPDRHHSLGLLGNALDSLFKHTRRVADIEEAISMHREALSLRPHPHPDRPKSLNNLGDAIKQLFEHRRKAASPQSPTDLDEAIACTRKLLVEHYIEGHDRRDSTQRKLQSLLQLRAEMTGNQGDLDEIEC
jgi:tetratricopeptide (TPR) repeat protein